MRKLIKFSALALISACVLSSCVLSSCSGGRFAPYKAPSYDGEIPIIPIGEPESDMPEPFLNELSEEDYNDFYGAYNFKLRDTAQVYIFADYIGLSEEEFVAHYTKGLTDLGKNTPYDNGLMDTVNLAYIIIKYKIPDDVIMEAVNANNNFYEAISEKSDNSDFLERIYSDLDVEALLSRDEEKILKQFASEYAIVVKDKIYTPAWVYYASADDYKEAGISSDTLKEKLEAYKDFDFTEAARGALEGKLKD